MSKENKKTITPVISTRKRGAKRSLDYAKIQQEYREYMEAGSTATALQESMAKKYNCTAWTIRRILKSV